MKLFRFATCFVILLFFEVPCLLLQYRCFTCWYLTDINNNDEINSNSNSDSNSDSDDFNNIIIISNIIIIMTMMLLKSSLSLLLLLLLSSLLLILLFEYQHVEHLYCNNRHGTSKKSKITKQVAKRNNFITKLNEIQSGNKNLS